MFSENTCVEIGLYVYRLMDPRNGETFYVGRGRNNRVFHHASGNIDFDIEDDGVNTKLSRIREINAAGLEVLHVIHRHDMPSEEAAVEEVYDQVRYAWRIDASRASKAQFVLAVVRGVVVGAFEVARWLPAVRENFPDLLYLRPSEPTRAGFIGAPAQVHDWERFVGEHGRRIVDPALKHVQNPIRYWNI